MLQGLFEKLSGVEGSQVVHVHKQGAHVIAEVHVVVLRQLVLFRVHDECLDNWIAASSWLDFLYKLLYPFVQFFAFAGVIREFSIPKSVVKGDILTFFLKLVLNFQILLTD